MALEAEIGRRAVCEELVAITDRRFVQLMDEALVIRCLRRKIAVHQRPMAGPFHTPLQRTHHAVGVSRGEARLPVVHPLVITIAHDLSENIAELASPGPLREALEIST